MYNQKKIHNFDALYKAIKHYTSTPKNNVNYGRTSRYSTRQQS